VPPRASILHLYDSYVVQRFVVIQKGLKLPRGHDLVVGQGATIVGDIQAEGNVFLAKSSIVRGSIVGDFDVVLGSRVKVEGSIRTKGNVLLLEDARVEGDVQAAGRIRIIGAKVTGRVFAGGDVEVRGESVAANIEAGGRVRTLPAPEATL
jgi:predicted acyltransferase (DUF342 family)